jgi:competence protein ComEA
VRYRFIFLLSLLPLAGGQVLPDGNGKDTAQRICGNCHDVQTVIGARRTKIGWERMVEDMISRGADGSDQEMEAVVDYLTRNFGKINVNTATAKELETELGLAGKDAEAICAHRSKNGTFKDFEQLWKVPGVNEEKLKAMRSRIAFSL